MSVAVDIGIVQGMPDREGSISKALQNFYADLRSVRGLIGRLPQLLAVFVLCGIYAIIVHKLHSDISLIADVHPDDFGRSLLQYFLANMAG